MKSNSIIISERHKETKMHKRKHFEIITVQHADYPTDRINQSINILGKKQKHTLTQQQAVGANSANSQKS